MPQIVSAIPLITDAAAVDLVPDNVTLPTVMAGGFRLTTTASPAPVHMSELSPSNGEVQPALIQSGPLINLNAFRADPRFANINGSGFASVIIDTGFRLSHQNVQTAVRHLACASTLPAASAPAVFGRVTDAATLTVVSPKS
jgi:hypothetical protein